MSVARDFGGPICISGYVLTFGRAIVSPGETSAVFGVFIAKLPVPADCWRSVSMDFIFDLPSDRHGHTGILVFVCRLSKMVRLVAVRRSVTAPQAAQLFIDHVFCHHRLPESFVSDRDPRFVLAFWQHLFRLLGTRLDMSTADHPQTDGQTERGRSRFRRCSS